MKWAPPVVQKAKLARAGPISNSGAFSRKNPVKIRKKAGRGAWWQIDENWTGNWTRSRKRTPKDARGGPLPESAKIKVSFSQFSSDFGGGGGWFDRTQLFVRRGGRQLRFQHFNYFSIIGGAFNLRLRSTSVSTFQLRLDFCMTRHDLRKTCPCWWVTSPPSQATKTRLTIPKKPWTSLSIMTCFSFKYFTVDDAILRSPFPG